MKAKTIISLLLALTWIGFVAITSLFLNLQAWFFITFLSFALIAFIYLSLQTFIFKPLTQLNHHLKTLSKKTLEPITISNNFELNEIIDNFNNLLTSIQQDTDQTAKIRQELLQVEQSNARLREEVAKQKSPPLLNEKRPLTRLSHYDSVTSLPNRIFFNEILNKAINHARRRKKICALLLIAFEHSQSSTNQLEDEISPLITKEIGNRLLQTLRSEDVLAQLSNDEFIVLLNDIGKPKFASAVAEKLLTSLRRAIQINNEEITLTTTIGICIYPNDGESLEVLLKNVETALSRARTLNKNSYEFYASEMNEEAREFITLDAALRKALQKNELALYYQPKFRIKTGSIDGVEALIRWIHPQLGQIDPAQIVALAEETGMTMKLVEWALREACQTNKHWQDEGYGHMTVAVNISPKQFHHPDTPSIIQQVLAETKLHPAYLEIEVNETAVMEDTAGASKILEDLKTIGVQITLDHFGIGYTSISHLKRFPINFLKIDRSFIKGLPQNPNDMAIINAFLALAHNLGLEVIAEGVESAEQVQYLSMQNCDLVQGYFLSHPLPAERLLKQLSELKAEVF